MPQHESTEGQIPPQNWPSRGAIQIKDLSVRYADDLPDVLHRVSMDVEVIHFQVVGCGQITDVTKPGMRVGLVGATGSGKSTLALCLFQCPEQA